MKIILKSIEITNFKGIEYLKFEFNDSYNVIYGDNETGKTAIYDAFCYCLTGKNSAGETNFSIVPKWLEIKPGVISPAVKIELQVDEKSIELERIYKAEFNKMREFKGFTTKCFVDGTPKGVNEFSAYIKGILGELDFRLVTNIKYFTEFINPVHGLTTAQQQLNILSGMIGEKSDLKFAKENEKYAPIIPMLEKFNNVQEVVAYSKKQISGFKKDINDIPIKIEQQSLNFVQIDCKENRMEEKKNQLQEKEANLRILIQNENCQKIISGLEEDLSAAYSNLDEAQQILNLSLDLMQYISISIQDKVNSLFDKVTFNLFDTSNGEFVPTCIIQYNGIEYKNLSASTKTICSLDIVNGFQKFYDIQFPVFIDNAEGITSEFDFDGQIISLNVQKTFCPDCGGATSRKQENNLWMCSACGKQFRKECKL